MEKRCVLSVTPMLIDLNPTGASNPSDFTPLGDVTYFAASDDTHGRELWVTDGTAEGTAIIGDFFTGTHIDPMYGEVPNSSDPRGLTVLDGILYFTAADEDGFELWRSDGTEGGTFQVRDINEGSESSYPTDLTEFNGELYFAADDGINGEELWKTDGTEEGTVLVRDIAPGTYDNGYVTYPQSSGPRDLEVSNGTLFFGANDGDNGRELWKTDGTTDGTAMVKEIFAGTYMDTNGTHPNSGDPENLTDVNGLLFFVAKNEDGLELWRSDGTDTGTFQLQDINDGSAGAFGERRELIALGDLLLFAADDGINGDELWRSDGTSEGTFLVKDIFPGSGGRLSNYAGFTDFDGTLYFSALDDVHGRELWKSDGTESGTVFIKDLLHGFGYDMSGLPVGPLNSYPYYFNVIDGTLYFSATNSAGRELWQTDGTEEGTTLVADVLPGTDNGFVNNIERVGETVLFAAAEGSGRELFVLVDEEEPTTNTARLTIFVNSEEVAIPADVGVNGDTTTAAVYTDEADGVLMSDLGTTVTLGDFFDIWRTDAGLAGNNPDAILNDSQLLDNVEDAFNTVQMFVNGHVSDEYGDYVLQDGDQVILIYGDNPVVSVNTNFGPIVIEVFEDETPLSADNFFNYVNDHDYDNSIFHRSADSQDGSDFVIQGGGFSSPSTTFTRVADIVRSPTDPPIMNEPGISNTRGTVAMAKTDLPNSATNQFFINLNDANSFLDDPDIESNTGGFTVFGQVLDLTTADRIAALPNIPGQPDPYGELPVTAENELVVIESVEGRGEITGVKFSDDNANGMQDDGEVGIANSTIYIDANNSGDLDDGEMSTTTDAEGRYLLQVDPGTHIVRSVVSPGRFLTAPTSPDSYTVMVEIGREEGDVDFGEALQAPTDIDLRPESDSGVSDDDDLTRLNNSGDAVLIFDVTGVATGAEVRLFSDGVQIGSATAIAETVTIVTDGVNILSDGAHEITATQFFEGGESDESPSLTVTIDATAPAPLESAVPEIAQVGQLYTFDADSPDEGQTGIVYSLTGEPSGMTINPTSGVVSWTPTQDQTGPEDFSIDVSDDAGNVTSQSVDVTVLGVIPAFPETYEVAEDMTLTVDAENGVLANDGDEDSGQLSAAVTDTTENGLLMFNSDGSFTYTPNANFFGEDSFAYIATDVMNISNIAKVTILVTPVNDSPEPMEDSSYGTSEDTPLTVDAEQGVLSNDVDVDGDELTATINTQPTNGTVLLQADGSFVYTPNAEFSGTDMFTYTVSDGIVISDPVTVSVEVIGNLDPPVGVADEYTVNEDETLTVDAVSGVLMNDTDPDSTDITSLIISQTTNGSIGLNSDGSFVYTPNANFHGTDSFVYRATDGTNLSEDTTVTITVVSQPDEPDAVDDSETVLNDGSAVTIDVLSNDTSEPDGVQALTITEITQGTSGTVEIDGGNIIYTAPTTFVGTDTFTYTIEDTDGLTDTATVTVTVNESANNRLSGFVYIDSDRDGARDAGETGVPGAQITLTGTDVQGMPITRTALTFDSGFYTFGDLPNGTYRISERQPTALSDGMDSTTVPNAMQTNDVFSDILLSGGQTFTENNFGETSIWPQYVGITWQFASSMANGGPFRETIARAEELAGFTSLAAAIRAGETGEPEPAEENNPPVAVDDSFSVDEDQDLPIDGSTGVLANDTDPDGDALNAQVVTSPSNGSLTLNLDGSFTYSPNPNFNGTDTFTYTANDGNGGSDQADVSITVDPVNDAPEATADTYSTDEDTNLVVDAVFGLLDNDTDPEGDAFTAVLSDPPDHGNLTLNPDGSFTYEPEANFEGEDTFSYVANDGVDDSPITDVTINVVAVEDPPMMILPTEFTDPENVASRPLGEIIDFDVFVIDPDDSDYVFQLDLEASGIPAGQALPTIDLNTGRFLWTPTAAGRFTIRVIVVDGEGEADQETFMIDIFSP